MELAEVVRRRRMVRSFDRRPVPRDALERVLDTARRGPSAGWSQGMAFVVLVGTEQTAPFWDAVLDPSWGRDALRDAPVVVLPLSHKDRYLERYSMPDKAAFGLGDEAAWPVPYWDVDTAFATMLLLLAAVDEGLGALFFGIFRGEADVLSSLGVPSGYRPIGAVALGYAAEGEQSRPSWKGGRRPVEEVVHYGRW
ncbi:MAG: nitroreductase family protein [Actinobacteria bacterium]|nr:nitroreductase family protein [Actinomycetota bacterium]